MPLRIAVVHEWLDTYAGSEKVLEQILRVLPQADLYSTVDFMSAENRQFLNGRVPITSFVQKLPLSKRYFRKVLPLLALGVENLDLSQYDVVISNSHAVAKGVLTGPKQLHLCYCHSPMRYAWDLQHQYLQEAGLSSGFFGFLAKLLLHYMRLWDLRTVNNVDAFACNSLYIARRIQKLYRRDAAVIYPPVDVSSFALCKEKDDFYLTASRLVPYKKVNVVVEAFNRMPSKKLIVVGDGPLFKSIRQSAGANIEMVGYQSFERLRDYMQRARAFVFAAEEDFGIVPVEAQACGTPVIAYGKGGATETVLPGKTGVFFFEQTAMSIMGAVDQFEKSKLLKPEDIRTNAEQFTESAFRDAFAQFVERQVKMFEQNMSVSSTVSLAGK